MEKKKINLVGPETRASIERKTAYALPDNPSAAGMKPGDIKKAFYAPITDAQNSIIKELDRVTQEANEAFDAIYEQEERVDEYLHGENSFSVNDIGAQSDGEALSLQLKDKNGKLIGNGAKLKLALEWCPESEYKLKVVVKDAEGGTLAESNEIDLPLETMISEAVVSDDEKTLTLMLKNGQRVSFGVADIVSGLVSQETFAKALEDKLDKTSLTHTLKGDEADKAPSVQAVNEGLDGKVDKVTAINRVYGTDASGNPKTYAVSTVLTQGHLAIAVGGTVGDDRPNGHILVREPLKPYQAANKKYVDSTHLALSMDEAFNLKVSLLNANNEEIDSQSIDLPLEEMIVSGKVSDDGNNIILTLKNSETIEFAVSALVGGLVKQETLNTVIEDVEALKKKKIELAPTLDGKEDDKAPSVKAVSDGLAEKVTIDRTLNTGSSAVYGRDYAGNQKMYLASNFNHSGRVAMFSAIDNEKFGNSTGDGVLVTALPKFPYHCAPKKYVDSMRLVISVDPSTYVMTASLLNADGDTLSTQEVDLPLEEMVVDGKMSEDGQSIVLTLKNGNEVTFSVASLVSGLVSQETFAKALEDKLDKSSLVTTLDGKEADKAPSVRAVNEGLATKLTALYFDDDVRRVYGVESGDKQTAFLMSSSNYRDRIAMFASKTSTVGDKNSGGALITCMPEKPYHCAPKKYVDDSLVPIKDAVTVVNRDVDTLKRIAVGSLCTTLVDVGPYSWGVGKGVPENALDIALVNRLGAQFYYEEYAINLFKNASVKKAHNVFYWSLGTNGSLFNFTMENDTDENGILRPPGAYVYFDPFTIPAGGGYYRIKIKPYTEVGIDTGSVEGSYCVRLCHVEKTENPYPAEEGLTRDNIIWHADGIGSEGCETKDEYGSDWVFLQPYDGKDWEVNCLVFESSIDAPSCSFDLYYFEVTIEKQAERIASYPVPKIISTTNIYEGLDTVDEITIPDAIQALEGYGLMYSEEKYNYLDFDNRSFVRVCKKDTNGDVVLLDTPEIVDVSADLPEDAGMISVVPQGHIATQRALDLAAGYEEEGFEPLVCDMTYLVRI